MRNEPRRRAFKARKLTGTPLKTEPTGKGWPSPSGARLETAPTQSAPVVRDRLIANRCAVGNRTSRMGNARRQNEPRRRALKARKLTGTPLKTEPTGKGWPSPSGARLETAPTQSAPVVRARLIANRCAVGNRAYPVENAQRRNEPRRRAFKARKLIDARLETAPTRW